MSLSSVAMAVVPERHVRAEEGLVPTYSQIQTFVQHHHGFVPKPSWIAHVKALRGLPTRRAANRAGRGRRVVPCPPEKREAIEQALRHFGLI
jgi:hypothetical protein